MDGFFTVKNFLRLLAAAIVLAALIVLINERIENSRGMGLREVIAQAQPPAADPAAAQREVTRVVEQTVLVTQIVERLVTATPEPVVITQMPTGTPGATATSSSATPETLDVLADGLQIWCEPRSGQVVQADETIPVTGVAPDDAILAAPENGTLTVYTQVKSCTFLVGFNRPFPEGLRLQVYDRNPQPFVDEPLSPLQGDDNTGYVPLDHHFIVDPPYWEVTYSVSVVDAQDEVLWTQPVLFKRSWQPQLCPNGGYPDPVSMNCPEPPE